MLPAMIQSKPPHEIQNDADSCHDRVKLCKASDYVAVIEPELSVNAYNDFRVVGGRDIALVSVLESDFPAVTSVYLSPCRCYI
jgi:hypothetical protein